MVALIEEYFGDSLPDYPQKMAQVVIDYLDKLSQADFDILPLSNDSTKTRLRCMMDRESLTSIGKG
jgi:hypothetical protein